MIGTATNTFARIRRTFQCDIASAYFPFDIVMFLFLFPDHTCPSPYASDSKSLSGTVICHKIAMVTMVAGSDAQFISLPADDQ